MAEAQVLLFNSIHIGLSLSLSHTHNYLVMDWKLHVLCVSVAVHADG
jgi:hypothetical protein